MQEQVLKVRVILNCYIVPGGWLQRNQWGTLRNNVTKDPMGYALYIKTDYPKSFAINLDDFKYASRPGSKCEYVYFESTVSGIRFAVSMAWVIELAKGREPIVGRDKYYVFQEHELKGESFPYEDTPF